MESSQDEAEAGMTIHEVRDEKKGLLPLLLLADEQEDMIDRGTMYVLEAGVLLRDMVYLRKRL